VIADSSTNVTIPTGLGPGDVPAGLAWPRKFWLILPESTSPSQNESIRHARTKLIGHADITVSEIRVKNIRGAGGLIYPLIPANDAAGLYRGIHRARTAVISFCGAKVLLDIGELPTNKGCMALEKFIQYKCSHKLVTRPEEVDGALSEALSWMMEANCEGPHDPRCLPASIFEANSDYRLEAREERRRFIYDHTPFRKSRGLADARGRTWQVGPNHTLDLLQVAGQTLPIGFHWDVQAGNKSSKIATGWETWHLPGRGYINIHPDAYIRGDGARKTHSITTKSSAPKPPKTPRSWRKGKGSK
jgi:hypothetical protein